MKVRWNRYCSILLAVVVLPVVAVSTGCSPSARGSATPELGLSSAAAQDLGETAEPVQPPNYDEVPQEAVAASLSDEPAQPPVQLASATMPADEANDNRYDLQQETMKMSTSVEPKTYGNVLHVDTQQFQQEVLESEAPVLVDFYADWCGPCRRLGPTLEKLAQQRPDAKIVKVNIDHSPELASRYRIQSIPAVMSFHQGKVVDQQVGLADLRTLEGMLAN